MPQACRGVFRARVPEGTHARLSLRRSDGASAGLRGRAPARSGRDHFHITDRRASGDRVKVWRGEVVSINPTAGERVESPGRGEIRNGQTDGGRALPGVLEHDMATVGGQDRRIRLGEAVVQTGRLPSGSRPVSSSHCATCLAWPAPIRSCRPQLFRAWWDHTAGSGHRCPNDLCCCRCLSRAEVRPCSCPSCSPPSIVVR